MEMEYRKCEILYLKLGLVEFFFAQYENSSYLRLHPKISHLCNDSPIVLQKSVKIRMQVTIQILKAFSYKFK
jgi:hypothetical protein